MKNAKSILPRGRPRSFDPDEALDRALDLFWRQGYEGTSLTDLTEAMGINRPSLYAAFGNKEELFQKALERYVGFGSAFVRASMACCTAREAVEALLTGAAQNGREDGPRGCLLVKGALAGSSDSAAIQQQLNARRAENEAILLARLLAGQEAGEFAANIDATDLARYFTTVLHGLSVQAIGGASKEELTRVVQLAMKAWPGN